MLSPGPVLTRLSCPGATVRVPALVACTLPQGPALVLVHDRRPRPVGETWRDGGGALPDDLPNPNVLMLRISLDAGTTWSDPVDLRPTVAGIVGVSDPSLVVDRTGTLHLLAAGAVDVGLFGAHPPTRPGGGPPENGTLRLLHAVSRDAQRWRWEDLTDVALPSVTWPQGAVVFPVSGHGLRLEHGQPGRLVQPVVAALGPGPQEVRPLRSACLLSDDQGLTWRLGSPVPEDGQGGPARSLAGGTASSGTDEHAVAEMEDGTVVMSARDGSYGGTRLEAFSQDGAESWGPATRVEELPDPGCNAGMLFLPGTGLLLSHADDPAGRRHGRLALSRDGHHWVGLCDLSSAKEGFGYSDLAVVEHQGRRQVVVVAEDPGSTLAETVPGPGRENEAGSLLVRRLDLPQAS